MQMALQIMAHVRYVCYISYGSVVSRSKNYK